MRKLVAALVVVAVLVAVLGVADVVVRHSVEGKIAARIEAQVPGTSARVQIHSFPFVGRIAASGSVPSLDAEVTGLKLGPFAVQSVDIAVTDLVVSRSQLLHGRVSLRSIHRAVVVGRITQQAVDAGSRLPVTLGAGTVGLAGVQVPAQVSVADDRLVVRISPLLTITVPLIPSALLPCSADAVIRTGQIVVSCTTTTIPPALLSPAT